MEPITIANMYFTQSEPMHANVIADYLNNQTQNPPRSSYFLFDYKIVIHDQEHTFPPLGPTYFVVIRWVEN